VNEADIPNLSEADHGGMLRSPQAFALSLRRVQRFGGEHVQQVQKHRQLAVRVSPADMVITVRGNVGVNLNACALGGVGEAVRENAIGPRAGAQSEHAATGAACDEKRAAGNDAARSRHETAMITNRANCGDREFQRVECTDGRRLAIRGGGSPLGQMVTQGSGAQVVRIGRRTYRVRKQVVIEELNRAANSSRPPAARGLSVWSELGKRLSSTLAV
jgi:hypothetical protein